MSQIQLLRERRAKVVDQMRGLTNAAISEERDLSDAENTTFSECRSQLSALDGQLERAQVIADAERSMATDPNQPRRGNDGTFEQACRSYSVTKAITKQIAPSEVDAGREIEVSQELAMRSGRKPSGLYVPHEIFEQRAVTSSNTGANLIPEVHRGDLMIDTLRPSIQVASLGATVMSGLTGDQDIPRLTGNSTAYWVADHEAVTRSDHTYDTVQLGPKTVAAQLEYARRMLINATPSIERLVINDLQYMTANAVNYAAINGDGTSNTPLGILNTTGIGNVSHGTNGGPATWESILELINELSADSALQGQLGFLTSPKVVKKLRSSVKVTSTDSQMIMNGVTSLADYTLKQSTHVPDDGTKGTGTNLSTIIFGNWSDLLIGYWSAVDILVNPYHTDVYSKGGVLINAMQDCDIAVRHPESFAVATDVDAS